MKETSQQRPRIIWFHVYETESQTREASPGSCVPISHCSATSHRQPLRAISGGGSPCSTPSPTLLWSRAVTPPPPQAPAGHVAGSVPERLCPSPPRAFRMITPQCQWALPTQPSSHIVLPCSQSTCCRFCQMKNTFLALIGPCFLPTGPLPSLLVAVFARWGCNSIQRDQQSNKAGATFWRAQERICLDNVLLFYVYAITFQTEKLTWPENTSLFTFSWIFWISLAVVVLITDAQRWESPWKSALAGSPWVMQLVGNGVTSIKHTVWTAETRRSTLFPYIQDVDNREGAPVGGQGAYGKSLCFLLNLAVNLKRLFQKLVYFLKTG